MEKKSKLAVAFALVISVLAPSVAASSQDSPTTLKVPTDLTFLFTFAVIVVGVLLYWMPRLTRPDLYFAVTVHPGFRDTAEGRETMRRYCLQSVLSSLLALGLTVWGWLQTSMDLLAAAVLVQIAGSFLAYLGARRRVQPYAAEPTSVREAPLAPRHSALPGGWALQAGPFVLLGAAALYLRQHWAAIPARFPNHWGADMKPNGCSERTLAGIYGPLGFAAIVCLLLAGLAYGTIRWSRLVRPSSQFAKPEDSFRRTVLGVLLGAEYLVAATSAWAALLPLRPSSASPNVWPVLALALAFVIVTAAVLARMGQGGTRAAGAGVALAREPQPVGDRTLDCYWKAGMFYVNPDDPALFIEKRFGLGYTLNFARPGAWAIMAAILLVPIAALVIGLASK